MKKLWHSILIQGLGSATTVLTVAWISWLHGLDAQGQFALLYGWYNALIALMAFGLPQGLLHLQYKENVLFVNLYAWVSSYLRRLFCLSLFFIFFITVFFLSYSLHNLPLLVLIVSAPIGVAHLLWRSLLLRDSHPICYSFVTAAPAFFLLIVVLLLYNKVWAIGFEWLFLISAICSALLSWLFLKKEPIGSVEVAIQEWPRNLLWSVSCQTGVQTIFLASTPALLLTLVGWYVTDLKDVGILSLGMQLYSVLCIGAVYLAPIVYDSVARKSERFQLKELLGAIFDSKYFIYFIFIGLSFLLMPFFLMLLYPSLQRQLFFFFLMIFSGFVAFFVRLLGTVIQSSGGYSLLTFQSIAKFFFTILLFFIFISIVDAVLSAAVAMLIVELGLIFFLYRKLL